jgi:ABC-type proline/glycine betaine transport system permease subunit
VAAPGVDEVVVHEPLVLLHPVQANDVGLPVHDAVRVSGVFTIGAALLVFSVHETGVGVGVGAGPEACQVTVVVAGALVPPALVAVTEKVLGPAFADAVEHVLVVLGQPVHA